MYKDILGNFLPYINDYKLAASDAKLNEFDSLSAVDVDANAEPLQKKKFIIEINQVQMVYNDEPVTATFF